MKGATRPISNLSLCYRFMKSFTEHVPQMNSKDSIEGGRLFANYVKSITSSSFTIPSLT